MYVSLSSVILHTHRRRSVRHNILNGENGYHITADLTPRVLYNMALFTPSDLEAGYLKNILLVKVRPWFYTRY